jgi:hypothetical protein
VKIIRAIRRIFRNAHDADRHCVQVAGCMMAALGIGIDSERRAKPWMYGWCPAYDDVLRLRIAFDMISGGRTPEQVIGSSFIPRIEPKPMPFSDRANA